MASRRSPAASHSKRTPQIALSACLWLLAANAYNCSWVRGYGETP